MMSTLFQPQKTLNERHSRGPLLMCVRNRIAKAGKVTPVYRECIIESAKETMTATGFKTEIGND